MESSIELIVVIEWGLEQIPLQRVKSLTNLTGEVLLKDKFDKEIVIDASKIRKVIPVERDYKQHFTTDELKEITGCPNLRK